MVGAATVGVGLGELAVSRAGSADAPQLIAHGLGSCIALCLYDSRTRVGGMAHVVLPGEAPDGAPHARYARNALSALHKAMVAAGASSDVRRYQARIAGGAQVLVIGGGGSLPRVGDRNIEAVRDELQRADVQVCAEQVGGGKGRTVWFDPNDQGRIRVRTVGGQETII